ncbi:hypothetical protein GBF38_014785 [Nibea albiflora]|uniref:Uncharacterized protein n=1 Tax=Nibea albiflora TaxID=240163 RepID=A0ACB7EJL0_NIBAL|nr:hypothetical protein GBF38_014785 [Nibea albiflora]
MVSQRRESERSRKSELMFADKGRSKASSESGLMQKQMRRQEGADSTVTHCDVHECAYISTTVGITHMDEAQRVHSSDGLLWSCSGWQEDRQGDLLPPGCLLVHFSWPMSPTVGDITSTNKSKEEFASELGRAVTASLGSPGTL